MDVDESSTAYGVAGITEVDSVLSFDAHYSIDLMDSALKITRSTEPNGRRAPLAPHEQGYDAATHNPLGRVFQIGLRYTLETVRVDNDIDQWKKRRLRRFFACRLLLYYALRWRFREEFKRLSEGICGDVNSISLGLVKRH